MQKKKMEERHQLAGRLATPLVCQDYGGQIINTTQLNLHIKVQVRLTPGSSPLLGSALLPQLLDLGCSSFCFRRRFSFLSFLISANSLFTCCMIPDLDFKVLGGILSDWVDGRRLELWKE